MKKFCAFVLCIAMLISATAFARTQAEYGYELGDKMEDFTVTTVSGESFTLSEVLKEKDMVLINIWATWCGPCRNEFPHMQEAYEAYRDDIEIIALSSEPMDTNEALAAFADNLGLTFPVARDTVNLSGKFEAYSIPTSVVIDRFGTICFKQSGALPSAESFEALFDAFVGDDYTSSQIHTALPAEKPGVSREATELLASTLGILSDEITVKNPEDPYIWPMLASDISDLFCVYSSNAGVHSSKSQIDFVLNAKKDDVFCVRFAISSESIYDLMRITVNGETVKIFSGERDKMNYAFPFEEDGEYTVSISYEKDFTGNSGEDMLRLYSVFLASGETAQLALSLNPAYPASADEITIVPASSEARKIEFTDPNNALFKYFMGADCFIANADEATLHVTLAHNIEPESTFAFSSRGGVFMPAVECMSGDVYAFTTGIDSVESTGYISTILTLYYTADGVEQSKSAVLLKDENAADLVVQQVIGADVGAWNYAE